MAELGSLTLLSSEQLGAKILFATDEWFAAAKNLLKEEIPVWKEGVFSEQGKWMDGWESRRKRTAGHDWCVIQLGLPGIIRVITIDTAYFTGNNAPRFSIQAAWQPDCSHLTPFISRPGQQASDKQLKEIEKIKTDQWEEVMPMTELEPGYEETRYKQFKIHYDRPVSHVRLNIYPDGGVARLKIFGEVQSPRLESLEGTDSIDLLKLENGGKAIAWSDVHYGHPSRLVRPGRGINMGDGWETARKKDRPAVLEVDQQGILKFQANDWCVLALGIPGVINKIVVDTNHFKGNFPESCSIEIVNNPGLTKERVNDVVWKPCLPRTKLTANALHSFDVTPNMVATHIKCTIFPDGGISRIRLVGTPAQFAAQTNIGAKL